MNLGNNKKIALGLIEEYSPNSNFLTDDEDIRTRLNLVYAASYQYLSQIKKILKTHTISIIEASDSIEDYDLPSDLYQFKRLVALDSNNKEISPEFQIVGKKIYIRQNVGEYIIEYYAYPTEITLDTPNTFELEIDPDVQNLLPYLVANDILKVDPSADYTAFEKEYRSRMSMILDERESTLSSAVVEEGIL